MTFIGHLKNLRKKLASHSNPHETEKKSAVFYNSVEHVDAKNDDAQHWLQSRESDRLFVEAIYQDILTLGAVREDSRVADFGCGTGVLVNKLKADFPDLSITGFDFSESKVSRCREFYDIEPQCFQYGSIYDPTDSTYDVIIATEVLEHLEYPKAAVTNLIACLNPGGRLLFTVPNGRTDTFHGHIHFWSPESWSLFIREAVDSAGTVQVGMLAGKNYSLITAN